MMGEENSAWPALSGEHDVKERKKGSQTAMAYVISVKQPWAAFILHPEWFLAQDLQPKDIENREWDIRTKINQPLPVRVLIHTGKEPDADLYDKEHKTYRVPLLSHLEDLVPDDSTTWMNEQCQHLGGIIGVVTITDCVLESGSPWFCGLYGFVLEKPKPLPFMPLRGHPGIFRVNTNEVRAYMRQRLADV